MALKTTSNKTRAALGTEAEETDAAVDVKLDKKNKLCSSSSLQVIEQTFKPSNLHNRDDLPETQNDPIHLSDEDTCHRDEERGTVHIDVAPNREDESGDSGIDPELLGHQSKSNGECSSPVQSYVRETPAQRSRL
uniref:Uncharacterized protein n=1 Tax=Vespula pensylvanica TaxID=30213 RepID=A0A834NQP6_VESPE|nr:hypothetical protein H0235_012310 [Vespula pensylvanica]